MAMTTHPEAPFEQVGKREFPPPKNAFLEFGREIADRGETTEKEHVLKVYLRRVTAFLLGLFIPVLGVCLYVVWRDDRPKEAKYPGLGTLIAGLIVFSLYLFIVIEYILFPTPHIRSFPIQIFPESTRDYIIPFPIP